VCLFFTDVLTSVFVSYSCVYKCVCKQFSERLYSDLLQKISCHLDKVSMELQVGHRVSWSCNI